MLGFAATDQIVGHSWNSGTIQIIGPTITRGVWTHLVTSYSITTGLRLWVNGGLIGTSSPYTYTAATIPAWITVGLTPTLGSGCATGNVSVGQFYGMIDEIRVYSRELTSADVYALANP